MEQTSGSGAGLPLLVQRTIAKQVIIMITKDHYDQDDYVPRTWCFSSTFIFTGSNEEEDWSGQVKFDKNFYDMSPDMPIIFIVIIIIIILVVVL